MAGFEPRDPLLRRCRTVVRCSLPPGEIARTRLIAGHVIQPCWCRLWMSQTGFGCRWVMSTTTRVSAAPGGLPTAGWPWQAQARSHARSSAVSTVTGGLAAFGLQILLHRASPLPLLGSVDGLAGPGHPRSGPRDMQGECRTGHRRAAYDFPVKRTAPPADEGLARIADRAGVVAGPSPKMSPDCGRQSATRAPSVV